MKKCPYCAEEIQDDAIKCRYCGEYLNEAQRNKSYSMNQIQKCILIAAIAVLVAMIAYPPFHVVGKNGAVFNRGYGWILDPPKHGYMLATVNVAMLLIQWIGVLVVGGIAFFLTKGASLPKKSAVITPSVEKPNEDESSKFMGGIYHPWRRLFARIVDIWAWGLLAFLVLAFAGAVFLPENYESYASTLQIQIIVWIVLLVLWIPIEAILLSVVGNTPAKWLFGISVRTKSGHKPSFSQALERSFRVVLQGEGLGIPFVALFTQLFAYRRLTKSGTTLWDTAAECVVAHKTWGAARAIGCVVTVILVFILLILLSGMASTHYTAYKQESFLPPAPKGYEWVPVDRAKSAKKAGKWEKLDYDPFATNAPPPAPREPSMDDRFIAYSNGTVLDTRTNLMWAAKDNGSNINWANAKSFCENYRGGGYTDWRMPTQDELVGLYDSGKTQRDEAAPSYTLHLTEMIDLTSCCPWASETSGSEAAHFNFYNSGRYWANQSYAFVTRALPVRSAK